MYTELNHLRSKERPAHWLLRFNESWDPLVFGRKITFRAKNLRHLIVRSYAAFAACSHCSHLGKNLLKKCSAHIHSLRCHPGNTFTPQRMAHTVTAIQFIYVPQSR